MSGEYSISAPRAEVWEALNDEQVSKTCVPDCNRMERAPEAPRTTTVLKKIGGRLVNPIPGKAAGQIFESFRVHLHEAAVAAPNN